MATYDLMPTMLLCMNPMGGEIDIDGIRVKEPTFVLDALWINSDKQKKLSYMV